uniref:VWFC domain-containing protein n=1 Tax=Erpetoichthys calabaricus TaxID=27687 RepID=A0A8C4RE59_ERPCA
PFSSAFSCFFLNFFLNLVCLHKLLGIETKTVLLVVPKDSSFKPLFYHISYTENLFVSDEPFLPLSPSNKKDTVPKKAVCHFNGKTYADEERWDIDSCTHCYCLQGQTLCSTVSCPALPCVQPINVEGSCCPMCSGKL